MQQQECCPSQNLYSPDLEILTITCHTFYLPQEFTLVVFKAVHVLPQVDTDTAISELHKVISSYLANYSDAALIVAGDFNHANLKEVIPEFIQHIDCYSRGERILDHGYSLCIDGNKATPCLYLGFWTTCLPPHAKIQTTAEVVASCTLRGDTMDQPIRCHSAGEHLIQLTGACFGAAQAETSMSSRKQWRDSSGKSWRIQHPWLPSGFFPTRSCGWTQTSEMLQGPVPPHTTWGSSPQTWTLTRQLSTAFGV